MARYGFAEIVVSPYKGLDKKPWGVSVSTTDPQLLEWIRDKIKKLAPEVAFEIRKRKASGENCTAWLGERHLDYHALLWWLFTQLCEQGWEPFSVLSLEYISFRKRYD